MEQCCLTKFGLVFWLVIEFRSYAQRVFGGWFLFFFKGLLGVGGGLDSRDDFMVFVGDKSGLKYV